MLEAQTQVTFHSRARRGGVPAGWQRDAGVL